MAIISIRLPAETQQQLEAIAARLNKSKKWVIGQALSEYVQKHEFEHDRWQQTLDAMESAARGKVVDASKVHGWLKSWGAEHEQDITTDERLDARTEKRTL